MRCKSYSRYKRWTNVGLTLVQRRRRWTNRKPTLIQRRWAIYLSYLSYYTYTCIIIYMYNNIKIKLIRLYIIFYSYILFRICYVVPKCDSSTLKCLAEFETMLNTRQTNCDKTSNIERESISDVLCLQWMCTLKLANSLRWTIKFIPAYFTEYCSPKNSRLIRYRTPLQWFDHRNE